MLQRGEPVDDGEFVDVTTNYYGWGRFRKDDKAQFTTTHRREGDVDWFFVAGEGKGEVLLNTAINGRSVEIWDAVSVKRTASDATESDGGKTRVALDLPMGGSCFVVFAPSRIFTAENTETPLATRKCLESARNLRVREAASVNSVVEIPIANSWNVSFAYHEGITAPPPEPIIMDTLRDWTTYGKDGEASSASLRYFSGTATYKTTVQIPSTYNLQLSTHNFKLSIGML